MQAMQWNNILCTVVIGVNLNNLRPTVQNSTFQYIFWYISDEYSPATISVMRKGRLNFHSNLSQVTSQNLDTNVVGNCINIPNVYKFYAVHAQVLHRACF